MRAARHIRRTIIGATAVSSLLIVVFAVQFALAQDPEGPLLPEPGSEDAPGYIGYGREWPAVLGEQEDCEIDPGDPRCPPPAPHSIATPVVSFSATTPNLQASYVPIVWGGSTQHRYKFELHRSTTATGTFTLNRSMWDSVSPVNFNGVSRGYYYKLRAKRCRVWRSETDCGDFGRFSSSVYVPNLPSLASGLTLSRRVLQVTARFSTRGAGYNRIELAERETDDTDDGDVDKVNPTGTSHTFTGTRGEEYRFRVSRCTDSQRSDCGGWTDWTPWFEVPEFPPDATDLDWTRSGTTLTYSFKITGDPEQTKVEVQEWTTSGTKPTTTTTYDRSTLSGSVTGTRELRYRFRVARCTDAARTDCAGADDRSDWSDWQLVPRLPSLATGLDLTRSRTALTATYRASGASYDVVNIFGHEIGDSTEEYTSTANLAGSSRASRSHVKAVDRDYQYKFKVRRCTDAAHSDCGSWVTWTGNWLKVPQLPGKPPTPKLSRVKNNLAFSFTVSDTSNSSLPQKYHLQRAGAITGTFDDYRSSTANDDKLQGVDRNHRYRLRVSYCTDTGLTDCGTASDWSAALLVPNLPSTPGTPTLSVNDDDLTVSYTATGTAHDDLQFQQSRFETRGFSTYTEGTLNGKVLSDVERNRYYKVQVRRCTDAAFTDCTGWSRDSNVVKVAPAPVQAKPKLASRADGKSAIASYSLLTGFNYTLQLQSLANTRGATWTTVGSSATVDSTASSRTYTGLTAGSLNYRARLSACTTARPRTCTDYDSAGITLSKAPAPSVTRLSLATQDDLTVVYTVTAWSNGTGDHYDFEIKRSETATGSFSDYDDATTPSTTPHVFNNVHTGYYYKARGRRCSDSAATICGEWSRYTAALNVPSLAVPAPTSITVSNPSPATVHAAFTPGLSGGKSVQYHIFEVGKSDTETGTYVYGGATNAGTMSPVTFDDLETGKWYKARGKGCFDFVRKRCGTWATSSGAVEVKSIGVTIGSGADGKSVIASFTLLAGYSYRLKLFASTSGKFTASATDTESLTDLTETSHAFTGLDPTSGQQYQTVLEACKSGTCVDYRSNVLGSLSKAPAPRSLAITLSDENDLTVGYTLDAWNNGSGDVLDFVIRRGESSSSTFDANYTQATTPSTTPHVFNNVHTGYYYKALGRRCSDSALAICGDWSSLSSAVNVPALTVPAPTTIGVSMVTHTQIQATFVLSSWAGQSVHNYAFEVGKSDTESGTYQYGTTKLISASPVTFGSLETGKWYKVRGKRCFDSNRKRCGSWAVSASAVETEAPNPKIKIDDADKDITADAGLPRTIKVSTSGLDRTKVYKVDFISADTLVVKFEKCDSRTEMSKLEDRDEANVISESGGGWSASTRFYVCESGIDPVEDTKEDESPPTDTLTINLVEGDGIPVDWGSTVDTLTTTVTVDPVPAPSGLRVDGDNRGIPSRGRFRVAWSTVTGATSYELRHGEECPDLNGGNLCADSKNVASWTEPYIRMNSSPYVVVSDTPRAWYQHLRRVQIRTVRNGIPSPWTTEALVYPSDTLPTGRVATTPIYGHHSDREYTFRICDDTFPAAARNSHGDWVDDIMKGAQSWENALNWSSANHGESRTYLSVSRDTSSVDQSTGRDTCPKLSVTGLIADVGRFVPVPGLHVMAFASHLGLWIIGEGDWNYPYAELRFVSRKVLTARCLGIDERVKGCAPVGAGLPSVTAFNILTNNSLRDDIDVLLLDRNDGWMPDNSEDEDEEDVVDCSFLEALVAHEVGHALGVGATHASGGNLLMNPSVPSDVCGPQPYDVAAMLTNYQTLR